MIEFINSNENDSISLLSKLIICRPPQIDDDEDDQIFVYALSGKYSYNKSKDPVFLLLHVPRSKENQSSLFIILFQIYVFLSYISNLSICILDKNYYIKQIETIKIIDDIMNMLPHNKPDYRRYFSPGNNDDEDESKGTDNSSVASSSTDENGIEDEEEIWENDNGIDQNFIANSSKILNENPEIIFLMKDSSIKSSKKINNDDEFCFKLFLNSIQKVIFIALILKK
ncbi:hypothetical protein M9Y10_018704 [Tritrichomonas musculus]|uniref:Uncharacterized protein n=1 Tax=Tritrichomonas musculus TaxID=1915356 RepID=A0ABR2HP60_9EUKA